METNRIADKNRIKADIADEIEEMRQEHELQYETRKQEYDDSLIKYKELVKLKVNRNARRRLFS